LLSSRLFSWQEHVPATRALLAGERAAPDTLPHGVDAGTKPLGSLDEWDCLRPVGV
jgi:hypothetical protein